MVYVELYNTYIYRDVFSVVLGFGFHNSGHESFYTKCFKCKHMYMRLTRGYLMRAQNRVVSKEFCYSLSLN